MWSLTDMPLTVQTAGSELWFPSESTQSFLVREVFILCGHSKGTGWGETGKQGGTGNLGMSLALGRQDGPWEQSS